ncbi:MAG: hypothetical protein AAF481_12360 [Acidobacteriota bacterium]
MLTMTNPMTVALGNQSYTIYRDDANKTGPLRRNERRRWQFYMLPPEPRIALDPDGNPIFSMVVYRHDEDRLTVEDTAEDVGGGILTFTVDLGVPQQTFQQIKSRVKSMALGDALGAAGDIEIDLTYVPFLEGTVAVAVAGEQGDDTGEDREFVESVVGAGKVAGVGGNRKAVMVKLTQAGAALMSQLDQLRTLPINVQYDLEFEHRLMGVTMRVWCDMESSYELTQTLHHEKVDEWGGYLSLSRSRGRIDKVTSVVEELERSKDAGVEVTPGSSEVEEETILALEKFGLDMLARELDKALEASPPPEELDRQWLESFKQDYSSNFNFQVDRKMVLVQGYTPSANLENVFQRGDLDEMVAFVDLRTDFFTFLKVPIRVNADFTNLPVHSVTVTVHYRRQRVGGGGFEEIDKSFNFTDGAQIQTFLTFANRLRDVTYDWSATVHYEDSDKSYTFDQSDVRDDFLVIDVGQLGMLEVDLGLGLVDLEKFPQAKVSCRYHSDALGETVEQSFLFDQDNEGSVWTEVIHEEWDNTWEYKVDWRTADGDILEGNWTPSNSSRVRVDAPIPDMLDVAVVCSGQFGQEVDSIAQVAVSLRYQDEANAYTEEGQLLFTADQQQLTWQVPLRNRELRDYEYRYAIIYRDGVIKNFPETPDEWLPGQPGFIAVGEKYTLEVNLYPMLLTYPDEAKVVQVDLAYEDPANDVAETDSFVFSADNKDPEVWRVSGADGGPKQYTYTVTYMSTTGEVRRMDPVLQEAEAIVIKPLVLPEPEPEPDPEPGPTPADPTPSPADPEPGPTPAPGG